MGKKKRVTGSTRVEARVCVKERIPLETVSSIPRFSVSERVLDRRVIYLIRLASRAVEIHNGAVNFDVTYVKKLVVFEAMHTTRLIVGCHIVKFTKIASQLEVGLVDEICLTNNGKAIL